MSETTSESVEILELRAAMWGSFLMFCETFFPLITGREFKISSPTGRESHFITISRELTAAFRLETNSLIINVPPGSGKSTILCLWVAWAMSRYPDSQFLYISYGFELAAKHTEFIRRIMLNAHYQKLFGIYIRNDMKSKDHFVNNFGGSVKAFGSSGPVTGQDAGLPNLPRFTGAVIMDDMHKPDEVHSDTTRESVIQNYRETVVQRPRSPLVPMIYIGQRLHEDDLPAFLLSGNDERIWKAVILQALDAANNALYPDVNPKEQLLEKKAKNPYVFSSQYQQEPIPAGGALYKEKDFMLLDVEPDFLTTFITADTAETSKSYNDATVFSFWGLYQVNDYGQPLDLFALHNIDCWEIRVEPKELEGAFKSFYSECMLHKTKPMVAAIEKKSTGVTLLSVLENVRGLELREVKRTKASGSKTDRFLEMQPYIASRLITFMRDAPHTRKCIDHLIKITANDTHRHDDIADTFYDAIKMALIDKTLYLQDQSRARSKAVTAGMASNFNQRLNAIRNAQNAQRGQ